MLKKTMFLACITAGYIAINSGAINAANPGGEIIFTDITENYSWAKEAIDDLSKKGIINGVGDGKFMPDGLITKEQLAAMIQKAIKAEAAQDTVQTYIDVPPERWSFNAVESTKDILIPSADLPINEFDPERPYSRSEIAASIVKAMGLSDAHLENPDFLAESFLDSADTASGIYGLCSVAAEKGIVRGSDAYFRPNDYVKRAEATVLIHRMITYNEKNAEEGDVVKEITQTPIVGEPEITADTAKKWAKSRDAAQCYIDVADLYWKYGELTGINPEVLYGQAAKETNFGKFTGNVRPEQNNWAGIKIESPSGDKAEDHESFKTQEDGVRAHFNHMCAYVGIAPIGEPHARYYKTVSASWAGTVKYAEELSGKWAPAQDYGQSLIENYVKDMENF